jgi:hypothetical protein
MITFRGTETVAISFRDPLKVDPQELFMTSRVLFSVEAVFKETGGLWNDAHESNCDIISAMLDL